MKETGAQHDITDLNLFRTDGRSIDQEIFAEQRSNLLLYSGDHYNRRTSNFYRRIRSAKELTNEQKLRLVKNHTQYICDTYVNSIVAPNPGVGFTPKNEKEPHDQKVADMHHSVWRDAYERYNIDDKIDDWADDFVQIGEAIVKIYFDPMKGPLKAYEQKTDKNGQPLFTNMSGVETTDDGSMSGLPGTPVPDQTKPVYMGEFCFEEIYGFNLIRPSEAKDIRDAEWLATDKMVSTKLLMAKFPGNDSIIHSGMDETYQVFDITRGGYTKSKDQTLVTEYYFRPCIQYPKGYFYITTKEGVLAEGELPGGIFPIVFQPYRKFSTTPRGRSPIKTMRPYQAEINRSASKMAEHQITLGDDKLIIQNGTKVSAGAQLPGIRSVNVTGQNPTIMEGRDGSQYLNYMNSQISELYQVMGVKDDVDELPAQLDPYTMLFRAARQKKKFQRSIKRFEKFLIEIVKTYLALAKVHLTDDALIYAVGRTERVNIPEFRQMPDICYEINVEAQSDDIETKLGKQIVINHALQYVGSQMKPEDIGNLMRQSPYANFDQSFDRMTSNYDNLLNDILALDRGEKPPINQYEDHPYAIDGLTSRMKKADFKYLAPPIQQAYVDKVTMHEQFEAQKQMAIQRANQGLIPTGGYLTVCDLYVADPTNPNKNQRVRLPAEALAWLIQHLEAQQSGLAPVQSLSTGAQADIANQITSPGAGAGALSPNAQASINQSTLNPPNAMGLGGR